MTTETQEDFRRWAKIKMAEQDITSRQLAKQIGIPESRVSEAIHGKRRCYVIAIINALGGDPNQFKTCWQ